VTEVSGSRDVTASGRLGGSRPGGHAVAQVFRSEQLEIALTAVGARLGELELDGVPVRMRDQQSPPAHVHACPEAIGGMGALTVFTARFVLPAGTFAF